MKRHTEASLQHLGLSQLFLQQLHCIPTEEMHAGKVFDHLRQLQQGLIRYLAPVQRLRKKHCSVWSRGTGIFTDHL